jgi:hypothetical protein
MSFMGIFLCIIGSALFVINCTAPVGANGDVPEWYYASAIGGFVFMIFGAVLMNAERKQKLPASTEQRDADEGDNGFLF